MKVAVIFNRESKKVINLFGRPNQETIGMQTIQRILEALKKGKHQANAFEGDKELIHKLEEFMPRVVKGEWPGMVFNVSYGIQGEARYTHVPGILEMVGIPYVGSGPLAHSLALDKVVSKTIFRQFGLPTPDFEVLANVDFDSPQLPYPLIVKPKNEAVSFGIQVVENERKLREAADIIFKQFSQPVLVEQYIQGREINVGLLGNDPLETLPPAELIFDSAGPHIYTYEDKTRKSGRIIKIQCPARLSQDKTSEIQELAKKAFQSLGCRDCARVDLRMDKNGQLFILEINSLPSLGEHGSYTQAAEAAGLDYSALVNRLIDVASTRYFGTPKPPEINETKKDPPKMIFQYLTERRDMMERRLREWTEKSSRTADPVGLQIAKKELNKAMENLNLKPVAQFTDSRSVFTWESRRGMKTGLLIIGHLDVPLVRGMPAQVFRRAPDRLYGEGIGCSRAAIVQLEFALSALRYLRRLRHIPLGVLFYMDEGQDTRYSQNIIKEACSQVKQVLILRPGIVSDGVITQRRGQMKFKWNIEGQSRRLGQRGKRLEVFRWTMKKLERISHLSSRKDKVAVGITDLTLQHYPLLLPHRCEGELLISYLAKQTAENIRKEIFEILGKEGYEWSMELISDRPAMKESLKNQQIFKKLKKVADLWEIPLEKRSSLWPSSAGLVPAKVGVVCGLGPIAQDLYTPNESISRISLMRRSLLLAQYLLSENVK